MPLIFSRLHCLFILNIFPCISKKFKSGAAFLQFKVIHFTWWNFKQLEKIVLHGAILQFMVLYLL